MALVASNARVSSYFASLGELASKIVHETDGIRQTHGDKWDAMSFSQRVQILDEHFVDEAVRTYYATRTSLEQQNRASRVSGADRTAAETGSNPGDDLPTYEMLFPRPVRTTGKFVQGGVTDESETSRGTFTYVDEFAGDFSWETKSQLELWLPEGQKLPSPRRTRRGVKDDSDSHSVSFAPQVQSEEAAGENSGVPSVRAMAQALQRSSGGGGKGGAVGGRAVLSATSSTTPPVGHKPAPPHRSDSISASSRADVLRPSPAGAVRQSPSPAPKPASARSLSVASNASNTSETSPETVQSVGGQNSLPSGCDTLDGPSTKAPVSGALSSGRNAGGSSPRPAPNPPARRDSLVKAQKVASSPANGRPKAMSTSSNASTTSSASSSTQTATSAGKVADPVTTTAGMRSGSVGSSSHKKNPEPNSSGTTASSQEGNSDSTNMFSSLGMKSMLGTSNDETDDPSKKSGFDFLDNW